MRSHIIIIAIVLIFLKAVFPLKCYHCDSMHDPRCGQYFCPHDLETVDCNELEMPEHLKNLGFRVPVGGCLTKVHEGIKGDRLFIRRTCYFGSLEHTEETCSADDPYLTFAKLLDCQVCDEDLCNTLSSGKEKLATSIPFLIMLGSMLPLVFVE